MQTLDSFVGSNSGEGFFSYFRDFIKEDGAETMILLKGGAGGGKSTLMKKIAAAAAQKGLDCERFFCPSAPDSLDGVFIPATGKGVLDATPPHALEATCHGAYERYLSLSDYLDYGAVREKRREAQSLISDIAYCRSEADKRLAAAGKSRREVARIAQGACQSGAVEDLSAKLAERLLGKSGGSTRPKKRFLHAVTPKGDFGFEGFARELMGDSPDAVYLDNSLMLGSAVLSELLKRIGPNKGRFYICYDPLLPLVPEHLFFPDLGVCFVTTAFFEGAERAELDSLLRPGAIEDSRVRIKILKAIAQGLIEDAGECLSDALALHKKLEDIFAPHTDFEGLDALADSLCELCTA